MQLALSSMYLQRFEDRHDLPGLAALARRLGFVGLELGPVVEPAALDRLPPGAVPVLAVHHPCPCDARSTSASGLVPRGEADRRRILCDVGRSIATAARYGARSVVLHAGRAPGSPGLRAHRSAVELANRFAAGQAASERYLALLTEVRSRRDELDLDYIDAVGEVLSALTDSARSAGVSLAVETACGADELPAPQGMRRLLENLPEGAVGAWLDSGHLAVQQNLGLDGFEAWRRAVGDRWLGAHLHDAIGLRDHLAAGMGTVDFRRLLAWLPPEAVLTCEFDWYLDPTEVRAGRLHIELSRP